jgi:hypothetical protein
MEPLINLKSSMSNIVSDIGWMFSVTILGSIVIIVLADYFKDKFN